jgi:hypothetical protein
MKNEDALMKRRIATLCACLLFAITITACGQAPALAPTPVPEPAWKQLSGGGASLSLPESYEPLDLAAGVDERVARLRQFGGRYARTATMTERSRRLFALWAFDTRVGYTSCPATVGVIRTRAGSPALKLDTFVDEVTRQLPALAGNAEVRLLGQQTMALEGGDAARLILEFPGACRKEALYTLRRGDRFWMVVYAADKREFERRLPSFERSIATFTAETPKS